MVGITEIRNGRIVTPDGVIEDGHVIVEGSRIARVGGTRKRAMSHATTIDADGRLVMPGLVDLHGDDIEQHRHPRSGSTVDVRTALTSVDRVNLLNGVTTKFHAIAFEDAPQDDRSLANAEALAREIVTDERTLGDNRLHVRCELGDESAAAVENVVDDLGVDFVSVMHHEPGGGQYDRQAFERHYAEDRNWPDESVQRIADERQSMPDATRKERIDRIADLARTSGVPLASHDDESPGDVETMADHGASVSEYPLTLAAARRASDLGLDTVMGAPNLVRGGSLWDNLSARAAVDAGVVDVLCADYHPPSLLAAPFVDTGESLSTRVNRVTRNPAEVAGLSDRGRIEVGARADVIVVDPEPTPTVEHVLVEGEEAVRTGRQSRDHRQSASAGPTVGS